jgi:hypothetical protein
VHTVNNIKITRSIITPTQSTPSLPLDTTTVINTGATGHFFKVSNNLDNINIANNSIAVTVPDGASISSTHTGLLKVPGLPASARLAHIFPSLHSNSLLSTGQVCDFGCSAIFTSTTVAITLRGIVILTGTRSSASGGLWTLDPLQASTNPPPHDMPPTITSSVNATLAHNTIADRVTFYHTSLFTESILRGKRNYELRLS